MRNVTSPSNMEKVDQIRAWLDEHWKGRKTCPICSNAQWMTDDIIGKVEQFHPEGKLVADSAYPLVVITCVTCGYSLLFNAAVIGLVKGEA